MKNMDSEEEEGANNCLNLKGTGRENGKGKNEGRFPQGMNDRKAWEATPKKREGQSSHQGGLQWNKQKEQGMQSEETPRDACEKGKMKPQMS